MSNLLDAKEVAEYLHISIRSVWRKRNTGELIQPVRIGRKCLWRLEELADWVKAGCPSLKQWKIIAPHWANF